MTPLTAGDWAADCRRCQVAGRQSCEHLVGGSRIPPGDEISGQEGLATKSSHIRAKPPPPLALMESKAPK